MSEGVGKLLQGARKFGKGSFQQEDVGSRRESISGRHLPDTRVYIIGILARELAEAGVGFGATYIIHPSIRAGVVGRNRHLGVLEAESCLNGYPDLYELFFLFCLFFALSVKKSESLYL